MIKTNNTSPIKKIDRRGLRALAGTVWRAYKSEKCDISLTLVSIDEIVRLNKSYLQKNQATDVIAFHLGENPAGHTLADIYICPQVAAQNANHFSCDLHSELARLVVHGMLHVIGYDDATDRQRTEMRRLEDRFVDKYLTDIYHEKK